MDLHEIFQLPPYALAEAEKTNLLTKRLAQLTVRHMDGCQAYQRMMESIGFDAGHAAAYYDYPFLPVRLFKEMELRSVQKEQVIKTMTSSGTSGQAVSKIFLDRTTAANQQKALVKIVSSFTGSSRMPMLIIDSPAVLKDREQFSARGAGILGFSIFARDKAYALDEAMQLDIEGVAAFLKQHAKEPVFLFGFTFMIWQHFYKELKRLAKEGISFDVPERI